MQDESQCSFTINPMPRHGITNVSLKIPAPAVFRNLDKFDLSNYARGCRESLHKVAAREGAEILVWSIDLDYDLERVCHCVCLRGVLYGLPPLGIARSLQPPPEYWTLDFLTRGVERNLPAEAMLKRQVEEQRLQRYDRTGKRLEDPVPEQLLMRALTETNWGLLISPADSPWGYINTATQRIYKRQYQAIGESEERGNENAGNEVERRLPHTQTATGDELHLEDTLGVLRGAGFTEDMIAIVQARAAGKKWRELPEYLTKQTGAPFDRRRVDAGRGKIRRRKSKLRAAGLSASKWKPRSTDGTVYQERLPDGALWNGRRTYAHKYQGKELEVLGDMEREKWSKLIRTS